MKRVREKAVGRVAYRCRECGRKYRTAEAAYRAYMIGCFGCGGADIDLDVDDKPERPVGFAVRIGGAK